MLKEFIIKDVRCFAGENRLKIRPLTFLVGENSTGKSTVLGCLHATVTTAYDSMREIKTDFNSEPYQMGSFSEIIRNAGKKAEKTFSLGFQTKNTKREPIGMFYTYKESGSEPSLVRMELNFSKGGRIIFNLMDKDDRSASSSVSLEKKTKDTFIITMPRKEIGWILSFGVGGLLDSHRNEKSVNLKAADIRALDEFWNKEKIGMDLFSGGYSMRESVSISPIRSKPKRTYDPIGETLSSEGSDVPMYLMRLKRTKSEDLKLILKSLSDFGKASGLFGDISVKAYGKGMNEPFQLQVKVRGTKSNLIDVGYGISQILPILVRIFVDKRESTFLIQDPEVHLHPRGQAELSSLFIDSIAKRQQKFIIETHSDYMLKRARIEIRKGKISKDDVSLIYLEPKGSDVKVHNISFDDNGNLLNVPPGYRKFFINETDVFLGFKD